MAITEEKPAQETEHKGEEAEEEEEEEELTFEQLGLDPRLIRALNKKDICITKPTPIQRVAIPLILVSFSLNFLSPSLNYKFSWKPITLLFGINCWELLLGREGCGC